MLCEELVVGASGRHGGQKLGRSFIPGSDGGMRMQVVVVFDEAATRQGA